MRDEADILARRLRQTLENIKYLGYSVLQAASAVPAMELLSSNASVALLFTDIVVPGGMNGAELAKGRRPCDPV